MYESPFQLAELFIAKEDGRSTIRLFTAHPTPLEEKNLGRLFAVMEIDSQDSINDEILEVITQEINSAYYQSSVFEAETAFESALQQVNQKLQEIIGEVGEDWLEAMNIVIGVQKDGELIFANVGRVIALMIHNQQIVDILDTTKSKSSEINPVKVFSNTVSGELATNSIIVFSTESILDYLSKEKIKRVLLEGNTATAVEQLHALLEEDTTNTNFAAMIMLREPLHADRQAGLTVNDTTGGIPVINKPDPLSSSIGRADSMSELVSRETQTEELLRPSLLPGLKKSLKKLTQREPATTKADTLSSDDSLIRDPLSDDSLIRDPLLDDTPSVSRSSITKQVGPQTPIQQVVSVLKQASVWIGSFIWNIARSLGKLLRRGSKQAVTAGKNRIASRESRNGRVSRASTRSLSASGFITKLIRWIQSLSVLQKAFFVVAIVVLLLFSQSVVNRGEKQNNKAAEQNYAEQMANIDVKINEGKAAALYDKGTARTLYIEARDLLAQIPENSDTFKERGEEMRSVIAAELAGVNNVVTIDNPSSLIDFTAINSDIKISSIILLGASVYGFDENNGSVYRANLENKSTTVTVSNSNSSNPFAASAKASPGTGAVVFADQTFGILNPISESLSPLSLGYESTDTNFVDVNIFGVRLYTLDAKNSKIFRHRKSGEDFGAPEDWLTSKADLTDARAMAIDGDIYVLKTNGSVIKLSAGDVDSSFSLTTIDPAISSGQAIYTDENTQRLYILDPAGKRVVVYEKTGAFVAQYTSPSFTDLKDMVVDEASNKVYVLNGTALFEIDLTLTSNSGQAASTTPTLSGQA
ncbi:MAG: hypothetical protein CO132_04685 [Candidatus Kerfeldbacteria bacterium CG_4_9_14_3_um_filter_45_8]|nr:MAG: hypothetical protein CO132_04685 [Candidatus Kerfeldbacteria bacterium CG_4_9_14_3_um_filter_45_8]